MFGHRKNQNHEATDNGCLSFSNTVHQIHYISELYEKIQIFSQKLNYSRLKFVLLKKFIILFKLEQCVLILGNEESEGKPQIIQGVIWTIYLIVSLLHIFFQAPISSLRTNLCGFRPVILLMVQFL